MWRRKLSLAVIVLGGGLGIVPAAGQDRSERSSRWGNRPGELTPEQRREMYARMAEHQLEHFISDYELTIEQQDRVQAKVEELKAEQWRYSESHHQEFQDLRQKMHDAFSQRQQGQEIDEGQMTALRERMRELWSGSPLMNPDRAAQAIEPLLPAEQVEKGRQRQAQRRAEREQRHEEMWQRWREQGREGRFGFGGDPWDRYLADFTRLYQLDQAQQAIAQSVLNELKQQRDMYRESRRQEYEAVRQIEDREARREAYEKLNEPTDRLFGQLKDQLMRIPTFAQRSAAEPATPDSQPAAATSQPAGTSTRPGDRSERRRSSRRGR